MKKVKLITTHSCAIWELCLLASCSRISLKQKERRFGKQSSHAKENETKIRANKQASKQVNKKDRWTRERSGLSKLDESFN